MPGKILTIRHGMSVKEISEVVSENVIASSKGAIWKATKQQISGKARKGKLALFLIILLKGSV